MACPTNSSRSAFPGRSRHRKGTRHRRASRQRSFDVRPRAAAASTARWAFRRLTDSPMGTRPGQLDPGVVLYLIAEKGMSASKVQDFLYRECGLKGLPGSATTCGILKPARIPMRRLPSTTSSTASASTSECSRPPCRHRRLRVHRGHRRELDRPSVRASPKSSRGSASRSTPPEFRSCAADISARQPRSGLRGADR